MTLSLLPADSLIVVGQRVYTSLYSRGFGVVTAIHGEQAPSSCQGGMGGAMRWGGRAHFTICFDHGEMAEQLPETILRGVQWKIYTDVASAAEVAVAVTRSMMHKIQAKQAEDEAKAKHVAAIDAFRADPEYAHLTSAAEARDRSNTVNNIRKHLKKLFPGTKFSVRSDRNSVRVCWTDGPTMKAVDLALGRFEAGSFDGMSDCYRYSANPFGDAFGSVQYVFTTRNESDAMVEHAIGEAFARYAEDLPNVSRPTVEEFKSGALWNTRVHVRGLYRVDTLQSLVHFVMAGTTVDGTGFVTQLDD